MKNKIEERKRDEVKPRGRRVQEKGIARDVMGHLDIKNFYFIFLILPFFSFILFFFYFLLEDDEKGT